MSNNNEKELIFMNELFNLRNVVVNSGIGCELIGRFLWAKATNYNEVRILKNLHFRYSKSKERWYYTNYPFFKRTNKVYSIEELREIYNKNGLIISQR